MRTRSRRGTGGVLTWGHERRAGVRVGRAKQQRPGEARPVGRRPDQIRQKRVARWHSHSSSDPDAGHEAMTAMLPSFLAATLGAPTAVLASRRVTRLCCTSGLAYGLYALERRRRRFTLAFALGCLLSAVYGFASGAWPFGVVEVIWCVIALHRYRTSGPGADRSVG